MAHVKWFLGGYDMEVGQPEVWKTSPDSLSVLVI